MQSVNSIEMQSAGESASVISSTTTSPVTDPSAPVARPTLVLVQRDGTLTIRDAIDAYMHTYAGRDTTRPQRLAWWASQIGDFTFAQLDADDEPIFRARTELATTHGRYFVGLDADGKRIFKAKRKPLEAATVNRYQAALAALFTWAIRQRIAPRGFSNPCRQIARAPENNSVIRFLSDVERTALLAECRKSSWSRLYLLVLMGLTSGARLGELQGLRWADIDFERGTASVARAKNGDAKVLILTPAVVEELRRFIGADSALVFASVRRPDVPYHFRAEWYAALKRADVRHFRFHDLRHSCASALAARTCTKSPTF